MIIAADNLSAARPTVQRALEQRDQGFLASLCQKAEKAGAAWLDLNPGHLPPAVRRETWRWLIGLAEKACGLTLMLDTPRPDELAQALEFCTRPPILNMATVEQGRLEPVLELASAHGLSLVAATMTATVPATAEERLELAAHIMGRAAQKGITGRRLILDPMIMPLALPDGERHAGAVLSFLRTLPLVADPKPLTMIALSNLTTNTAGARTGFAAGPYLAAACGAGLDAVMLDISRPGLLRTLSLCRVFQGEKLFAPAEFGEAP